MWDHKLLEEGSENNTSGANFDYCSASYASSRFTPGFNTEIHAGTRVTIMATAFMVTIFCAAKLIMLPDSASPYLYTGVGAVGIIIFAGCALYHIATEEPRQFNTPISSWGRFNNSLAQEVNVDDDHCAEITLLPLIR